MAAPPGPEQVYVANLNTGTVVATTTLSFTLDTATPAVAISSAGGQTNAASQTISGAVTEPTESNVVGTTVTVYDGKTSLGTTTVQANGTFSLGVMLLGDGAHSITASDTDLANNTGASSPVAYTLDTQTPAVVVSSAGGQTNVASQKISGTVTEPTESEVVGTRLYLYDNGSTAALGSATVQSGGGWSTTVTLSQGANSIVAKDTDLAGNTGASSAVSYTLSTASPAQPAITSASYSTQWVLGGSAAAGSTLTVYDGAGDLGTTAASATGAWIFPTAEDNSAIRDYTVTAAVAASTSIPSAGYFGGTAGNDTFNFATESALSAAALINGDGGTDTLQLTSAATLRDADFAHAQAIEALGLTGASSLTLGPNAAVAGIKTVTIGNGNTSITDTNSGPLAVNATALPAGSTLTLAGSAADTVTGLQGNLSATGDSGALTVTATGMTPQTIQTGSGADSITAAHGGDTIRGSGGGDSINVSDHTAADDFVYAATSDSLNTTAGHDTISGFLERWPIGLNREGFPNRD